MKRNRLKHNLLSVLILLSLVGCGGGGGSDSPPAPTPDTTAPVITAPDSISVAAESSAGTAADNPAIASFLSRVSATDNVDGRVNVSNNAPALFPLGVTTVTFTARDASGNQAQPLTRTVTVYDGDAPVITLNGATSLNHVHGSPYVDPGAVAEDVVDGSVTVTVEGSVDTEVMGIYRLVYSAQDSEGNMALEVVRTVNVITSVIPNSVEPYISEYAEGSASNRYIEIYNDADIQLSLAGYGYAIAEDGADTAGFWDSWNSFDISATVEAKSVFTLCQQGIDERIEAECDLLIDSMPDGNDSFALVKGSASNYAILDRIGELSTTAPADGWDVCGYQAATADRTLIKKPFTAGFAQWPVSAGSNGDNCGWLVLVEDDWTNIGQHSSTQAPSFESTFKLVDSKVSLRDYDPATQAVEEEEFDTSIEDGVISVDLRSAPLNLLNLTNAVEGGDFQDAVLKFAIDSALPSAEKSAVVDLYITTGIDGQRDSNESQIHCQVALNWTSNGASASILEPPQEITLVVTRPSFVADTVIGPFDVFEVIPGDMSTDAVLELKLMTALNEAVKIAPELLMSLLVPRRLHVRVVATLPLEDAEGHQVTELSARMKIF